MKIEYLKEGSEDCPLIRIYGDDAGAIKLLMDNLVFLISGEITKKIINDIDGFSGINECKVAFVIDPMSKGILQIKDNYFECILTKNDWENVYDLLEPLSKISEAGYQWLDETSNISLLVTRYENGQW